MDRFHVFCKRFFKGWFIALAVILTGCGSGGTEVNNRTADTEMAKVSAAIEGAADLKGDAAKPGRLSAKPAPAGVVSIRLEVTREDTPLFSECKNLSPEEDPILFNFEAAAGASTDFAAQAFSAADCGESLLYEGKTIGVVLLGEATNQVKIHLSFVGSTPPTVTTEPATDFTTECARLNGRVQPRGFDTVAWFEWGTELPLSSSTLANRKELSGNTETPIDQVICGLSPGTVYHFRAAASNGGNLVFGEVLTFAFVTGQTPVEAEILFGDNLPPVVVTNAATDITATSATVHGTVDPEGSAAQGYIEFGTTTQYGNTTPLQAIGNGFDPVAISANLTGLISETVYHFRIVAFNPFGLTVGADQNFIAGGGPDGPRLIFSDDFENALDVNWTVSGNDWARDDTDFVSATHSVTDSPEGNFTPSANAALTMAKSIDLSTTTSPVLVFWEKRGLPDCDVGRGGNFANDHAYVEVSDNGGISWVVLLDINCSVTTTWFQTVLDLSAHKTSLTKIRFRLAGDGDANVGDGWVIDDVEIKEKDTTTVSFPFFDHFESGLSNWTVSRRDWALIDTDSVSPTHSVTDSPEGNFTRSANAALTMTRTVDLSGTTSPVLAFWEKRGLPDCDVGRGGNFANDHAYVEVSDNGGISWVVLLDINCSVTTTWFQTVLDLSAHKTTPIKIRFRLAGDGDANVGDGWMIDSVEIRERS